MAKTKLKVNIFRNKQILKILLILNLKDGVHTLRNPFVEFTEDEIKLMKTQDCNYIKFHQQMEAKVKLSKKIETKSNNKS